MLDVGCGSGICYRLLNNYKSVLGLDFSKTMIELAEKKTLKEILDLKILLMKNFIQIQNMMQLVYQECTAIIYPG